MATSPGPAGPAADSANVSLIHRYYAAFNDRRIPDAASMFTVDAILEHLPFGQKLRGPDAYSQFAEAWLRAFPDARLTVERIVFNSETIAEVNLLAEGQHCGTLQLGSYGSFKPSGQHVALRVRELLEFHDDKISYSCLSFDTHALMRLLAHVDYTQLLEHLDRIHDLRQTLAGSAAVDERRTLAEQIGRELDAARLVVRPWFRR